MSLHHYFNLDFRVRTDVHIVYIVYMYIYIMTYTRFPGTNSSSRRVIYIICYLHLNSLIYLHISTQYKICVQTESHMYTVFDDTNM